MQSLNRKPASWYMLVIAVGLIAVTCLHLYHKSVQKLLAADSTELMLKIKALENARNRAVPKPHQYPKTPIAPGQMPIPSRNELIKMSMKDLHDFFNGYIHSVQILCNRRIRMGSLGDGGWDLCEDPQHIPNHKDCLVYSFGIAGDWTYDSSMEKFGCEVHSFDPSMGNKDPSKGEQFVFHKTGISNTNSTISKGWIMQTLAKARQENGHEPAKRRLDVVKLDVEGSEMGALQEALKEGSLNDVAQLAFEIHIRKSGPAPQRNYVLSLFEVLRGLWKMGFRLYFTNRNISPVNKYKSSLDGREYTLCYEMHMVRAHY